MNAMMCSMQHKDTLLPCQDRPVNSWGAWGTRINMRMHRIISCAIAILYSSSCEFTTMSHCKGFACLPALFMNLLKEGYVL